MGLSGSSKETTQQQQTTANTSTNQYQTAQQLAAQLQQQQQQQSSTNTNGPSAFAQPYIQQALKAAQDGYDGSGASQVGSTIQSLLPGLMERFTTGSSGYTAPRDYLTGVMNDNGSNPQLEALIAQTNDDVANGVNARIGTRGGAGGSAQQQLLARELAKNETGLRYSDYTTQQGRKDAAARSLTDLVGAQSGTENNNLAAMLAAAQAGVAIPQNASNSFAQTIAQLLQNATTQTGTSSASGTSSGINAGNTSGTLNGTSNSSGTMTGSGTEKSSGGGFLDSLLGLGGMALGGWAGGGFK